MAGDPNIQAELPANQFHNAVRALKQARLEQVAQFRQKTFDTLKRLGAKRDRSKPVLGVPKGSDHCDFQSLFVWMDKIQPDDAKAVEQVVALDATTLLRMES